MWEINNIPGRYIPSIFGVKFLSELKDFTPGIGFVPRDWSPKVEAQHGRHPLAASVTWTSQSWVGTPIQICRQIALNFKLFRCTPPRDSRFRGRPAGNHPSGKFRGVPTWQNCIIFTIINSPKPKPPCPPQMWDVLFPSCPRLIPALPFQYQFAAGAIAGVTEILVMYPLDVVKTRFQLQVKGVGEQYSSMLDCVQKIIKKEGYDFPRAGDEDWW